MKKIIFILLFIGVIHCSYAQNENTKWYFGNHAALDFMTTPPTVLNNSAMFAHEGCASIADSLGNLLFYTNGVYVYNQQHNIMANGTGLLGDNSSTQSSLIIKQPNNTNVYYIFTMATTFGTVNPTNTYGLKFSIIDMSLAAGMGSVTVKNVPIYASPCSEKLHATKHANDTDYWVVIHELNSNNFRTYLLNSTGVNTTAIISSTGNTYTTYPNFIGSMKISPTGKNLGMATTNGAIELYNFNRSTGTVSNPLTLITNSVDLFYGCEFSSDGTKFYACSNPGYGVSNNSIIQWDLSSGINASIVSSSVVLSFGATITTNTFIGSMQLASNGKIYITQFPSSSISLVNNPNKGGTACNFVYNAQPVAAAVNSTLNSEARLGLPNMIQPPCSIVITSLSHDTLACNDTTLASASITYSGNIGSINCLWSNGTLTYSTAAIPQTSNLSVGLWNVNIYDSYGCTTDSSFSILQAPFISVSKSDICANEPVILTASGANTYTWSTLQTGASITVTPATSGVYTVFGTDEYGCENSNQILISVSPCTGIDELKTENENLKIYPNPVIEILNVEFENANAEIKIFDVLGNEIKNEKLNLRNRYTEINVSELKRGIYFVKIKNELKKFVKD